MGQQKDSLELSKLYNWAVIAVFPSINYQTPTSEYISQRTSWLKKNCWGILKILIMLDIDDIAVMWLNDDMELAYIMFKHDKVGKSKFKRALVRNAIKLRKIVDEDVSYDEHHNALDHNRKIWDRLKYFLSDKSFNSIWNLSFNSTLDVCEFRKHKPKTTKTYNKNIKIKYKGRTIAEAPFCDPELIY